MNVFASVGRPRVWLMSALTACALLTAATQAAAAGPDTAALPAMEGAAPPSASAAAAAAAAAAERASAKPSRVASESASALLVKQQTARAVALPDDREIPFPRAWMLGLLAVLALVVFDRIRLSMKLAKLNQDASRSSGLSGPFARN